jgi:hypothetical protein
MTKLTVAFRNFANVPKDKVLFSTSSVKRSKFYSISEKKDLFHETQRLRTDGIGATWNNMHANIVQLQGMKYCKVTDTFIIIFYYY